MASGMFSVVANEYTKPDGYVLATLPRPTVTGDKDVLVRVHAASINPFDVKKATGAFKAALQDAFPYKIGYDVAGVVEAVGAGVTKFKAGDEVYTRLPEEHRGSWSEYALTDEPSIAHKPANISFSDAAALPIAGMTGLQALKMYKGSLQGKTVFVPGGLSGSGSVACQLAKKVFGAGKVITTVSTSKVPLIPQLLGEGVVDQIIDYTKESPRDVIPRGSVDLLFDTQGLSMEFLSLVVPKTGLLVSPSTTPSGRQMQNSGFMDRPGKPRLPILMRVILDAINSVHRLRAWRWGVPYTYLFLEPDTADLETMKGYVEDGKLSAVVGSKVDVRDIEAVRDACKVVLGEKGGVGKTVLEVIKE